MNLLEEFIMESNRIEGIRGVSFEDVDAHFRFLEADLSVYNLEQFVQTVAQAKLRRLRGADVQVGGHIAPRGGPLIEPALEKVLEIEDPHVQHCAYLTLHPFMDGNGRSARALWLKRRGGAIPRIGFLQTFYYEALAHADSR